MRKFWVRVIAIYFLLAGISALMGSVIDIFAHITLEGVGYLFLFYPLLGLKYSWPLIHIYVGISLLIFHKNGRVGGLGMSAISAVFLWAAGIWIFTQEPPFSFAFFKWRYETSSVLSAGLFCGVYGLSYAAAAPGTGYSPSLRSP